MKNFSFVSRRFTSGLAASLAANLTASLTVALASTLFFGCAAKEESKSLSYEFTENNCPTGKQTFGDQAAYCAGLKNDTLNKGCARSLRADAFKAQCPGSFNDTTVGFGDESAQTKPVPKPTIGNDGASPKNLHVPTEQFGAIPKSNDPSKNEADKDAAALKIQAIYDQLPKLSATSSESNIGLVLSGSAVIQAMVPDYSDRQVQLISASSVKIISPDMGNCAVTALNFANPEQRVHKVSFTLIATDVGPDFSVTGCSAKFAGLRMGGFVAEFLNVRVGSSVNYSTIPKVRFEVQP